VLSQTSGFACALKFRAGSRVLVDLCIDAGGALYSWNYLASSKTGSTARVTAGSGWHTVQMRVVVAGSSSRIDVWLDGVAVPGLTSTASLGTLGVESVQLGGNETGKSYDIAFDGVEVGRTYL